LLERKEMEGKCDFCGKVCQIKEYVVVSLDKQRPRLAKNCKNECMYTWLETAGAVHITARHFSVDPSKEDLESLTVEKMKKTFEQCDLNGNLFPGPQINLDTPISTTLYGIVQT
jgi:hypothetical protein